MTASNVLPGVDCAQVECRKVVDYLLSTTHTDGAAKARFFLARGARADRWEVFAKVLVEHARLNPVVRVRDDPSGRARLFQIDCHVKMPDDSAPCIRTVWELRTGAICPRLVTAYPAA